MIEVCTIAQEVERMWITLETGCHPVVESAESAVDSEHARGGLGT